MYQKLKKTKPKQVRMFDYLCVQILDEEMYRLKETNADFICCQCISHAEKTVDYYCFALKLFLDTLIEKNQSVETVFPHYDLIAQKHKVRIIFHDHNTRVEVDCQSFEEMLQTLEMQEEYDLYF